MTGVARDGMLLMIIPKYILKLILESNTLKHIYASDFLQIFRQIIYTLNELEQKDGSDYILTILNYSIKSAKNLNRENFFETVKEGLSEKLGDEFMTVAEQLIQEGLLKGKHEGLHEGLHRGFLQGGHAVLLHQLKRKFEFVPNHIQDRINQANEKQIYAWSENLIDAKTVDEVFLLA